MPDWSSSIKAMVYWYSWSDIGSEIVEYDEEVVANEAVDERGKGMGGKAGK